MSEPKAQVVLLDEEGATLNESTLLVTEHNGTKGDSVDRVLKMRALKRYTEAELRARPKDPVKVYISSSKGGLDRARTLIKYAELQAQEVKTVHVRVVVPAGTPEAIVSGGDFQFKGLGFPR